MPKRFGCNKRIGQISRRCEKKESFLCFLLKIIFLLIIIKYVQYALLPKKTANQYCKRSFYYRKNGSISIIGESERIPELETPLKIGRNYIFKNKVLIAEKKKKDGLLIDLDKVCGTIILRNRRYGDKIKLSGRILHLP